MWDENKYFSELVHQLRNNHRKARVLDRRIADERIYQEIKNPKRFSPALQTGELVLWRQSRTGSRKQGTATKLFYQCTGPHRVLEKKENHDLYALELGNSGIRKEWIPGEHLRRLPARLEHSVTKPRNTNWMIDEDNRIIGEHNVGDIVALKFQKRREREANMNVLVGEIIRISNDSEKAPVLIHLFGPYPRKNLAVAAHQAAWSPLIKTDEGEQLAKDISASRRSWKGRRVTIGVQFADLMPIPPLELRQGKISEAGKIQIKKYLQEIRDKQIRLENQKMQERSGQDSPHVIQEYTQ